MKLYATVMMLLAAIGVVVVIGAVMTFEIGLFLHHRHERRHRQRGFEVRPGKGDVPEQEEGDGQVR